MTPEHQTELTLLLEANTAYRLGNPIMSDEDFNRREAALQAAYPGNPALALLRNDVLVGATAPLFMWSGSQQKAMNMGEAESFLSKYYANGELINISHKYDGASSQIKYDDGYLKLALTKGDGEEGTIITSVVAPNLPFYIGEGNSLNLRAEICLAKAKLPLLNKALVDCGFEPMENTRNAVPAMIRAQEKYRPFFYFLDVIIFDMEQDVLPHDVLLRNLEALGFKVATNATCAADEVGKFFHNITLGRDSLPYVIDGVVIVPNDKDHAKRLGITPDRKYRYGEFCIKFEAERAVTTLVDIEWSAEGRNYISPVGIYYPPVYLAGATLNRVGLKSLEWLTTHKVGIGTVIQVVRSGDVIPYLETDNKGNPLPGAIVDNTRHDLNTPAECPACGAPTRQSGARLECTAIECSGREAADMVHFCDIMKVDGMGHTTASALLPFGVNLEWLINSRTMGPQILPIWIEEIRAAGGPTGTMLEKILEQLHALPGVPVWKWFVACGVRGLGLTTAEHLWKMQLDASLFHDLLEDAKALSDCTFPTGGRIGSRADIIAGSVKARNHLIANHHAWTKMFEAAAEPVGDVLPLKATDLAGKTVCMSGSGPRTREILKAELVAAGAIWHDSVAKTTQVLIVADKNSTSTKVTKAAKNGTDVREYGEVFAD